MMMSSTSRGFVGVQPSCRKEEETPSRQEPKLKRWWQNQVLWLILAIVLGMSAGLVLSNLQQGDHDIVTVLAIPGKLWLKALKCIVLPLIVFSMIGAMVMLRSLPGARRVGLMVVASYVATTLFAALEGCFAAALILGPTVPALPQEALGGAAPKVMKRSLLETVLAMIENLVPGNLMGDAVDTNLLPVIVASIIFGLLIQDKQEDGTQSLALKLIGELNRVVEKVVTIIMTLTPLGVGSLVFSSAASLDLAEVGQSVAFLVLAVVAGLLVHVFAVYPVMLLAIARRNPLKYYANLVAVFATALGTSSSAATLPLNIRAAVEKNGISPHIAQFVLSLGATVNMDGTTIYLICATYFLAALHGITFGFAKFLMSVILATLCSLGTAPVPSASLVLLATILTAVGVPLDDTFGLITAVDWIPDRLRTGVNVAGDATVTAIIDSVNTSEQEVGMCESTHTLETDV